MSLADELLADLEEGLPDEMETGENDDDEIEDIDVDAASEQLHRGQSVHAVAKLDSSPLVSRS